jgi:hypothetical protein
VHLLRLEKPPEPAWEPDQGWRVLDADGHVVNAGPRTILHVTLDLGQLLGIDEDQVPLLDGSRGDVNGGD